MAQPVWITPSGNLGTVPEEQFFQTLVEAYDPDSGNVYFKVIAGDLPPGVQCDQYGLLTGVPKAKTFIEGVPLSVNADVTSKFTVRSYTTKIIGSTEVVDRINDRTFTLTVSGQNSPEFTTPAGQIAEYVDGAQVTDLQISYTDQDTPDLIEITLKSGSLPPGLTISSTGLITGIIDPLPAIDPSTGDPITSKSFNFMLEITDGKTNDIRSFSILVWAHAAINASSTFITADNTFLTADLSPIFVPLIVSPAPGNIGPVRNDNFFAVQFVGVDPAGGQVNYELGFDIGDSTTLPGLTLDPTTGWLYGYIPNLGITENTYNFYIKPKLATMPWIYGPEYNYSLTITGPVSTDVTWLTDANLGTIDNGGTSTFYVAAVVASGQELQYRLKSGTYNDLPQGLSLLPSGHIVGNVSFDTFSVDGGATTFDAINNSTGNPSPETVTTFDMTHTFTVNAFTVDGLVSVYKTFTITVDRKYNQPYNNLYVECMPPQNDRDLINNLLQNTDIFQPKFLYRADDPNFGKATNVVYWHAYGLNADTYDEYVSSLYQNHYWKNLTLGEIKVAQATDSNGNVIYEVVYSEIIDDLVNSQGESVSKEVTLPYTVTLENPETLVDTQVSTVYPNSLIDMRNQVIDVVGQESNILPQWMTSKQADGRVLGFVPAWVITYTKPGYGNQVKYYINTIFGDRLNLVDFEVDRYELDRRLSKNWDPAGTYVSEQDPPLNDFTVGPGIWDPSPATDTTFDIYEDYLYSTPSLNTTGRIINSVTYTGNGVEYKFPITLLPGTGTVIVTVNGSAVDYATDFEVNYGRLPNYVIFTSPPANGDSIIIYQIGDIDVTDTTGPIGTKTTFDQDSMQFIAPVDMYTNTQEYDKYLVFPYRTIFRINYDE